MKSKISLIIIIILSFLLYSFRLNSSPSLYVDEAVVGYDAYSILHTLQDQYGQFLPIYFRFFGAYTPGLFVYLIVPFVHLFGLTPFAIRFLSVLSGVTSIYVFYQFLSLLIKSRAKILISTIFYAILPWSIFNSRLGYEVMFASTIFNLGVYLLAKHNFKNSYLALFIISLSTYAAHTQRILAPIFLLTYFIFISRPKFKHLLFLFLTQIPNIIMLFTPAFWIKTSATSFKFFLLQLVTFISPKTLFFELPDIDLQHQLPKISVFFWWMLLPLILGIHHQFKQKNPMSKLLLLWVFLAIIPASLTGEFISIQRALPLLFPLMLVISCGLNFIPLKLLILLAPYSLLLIFRSYYVLLPAQNASGWNYGYDQLSDFIASRPDKTFLIDNSRNPRNYILPLFYLQYLPSKYHQSVNPDIAQRYYYPGTYSDNYHYSNLTFSSFDWQDASNYDYLVSDGLTFSEAQALEHGFKKNKTIVTPQNVTVIEIYQK